MNRDFKHNFKNRKEFRFDVYVLLVMATCSLLSLMFVLYSPSFLTGVCFGITAGSTISIFLNVKDYWK